MGCGAFLWPRQSPGKNGTRAIIISGCTGKYNLINDTYEPLEMLGALLVYVIYHMVTVLDHGWLYMAMCRKATDMSRADTDLIDYIDYI